MISITYRSTKAGIAHLELISRAIPSGKDRLGNTTFTYEPLPESLKIQNTNPQATNIVQLQGRVAVIGLNTLLSWGMIVDPANGLKPKQ
jgi:hypothetical protein